MIWNAAHASAARQESKERAQSAMAQLTGKIVLVTGAVGAIGSAICAAIQRAGGQTVSTDLAAGSSTAHALDVTRESDWQRVIGEIERAHGRLDGLVNSAGIVALGTVEELDFATWKRVQSINL